MSRVTLGEVCTEYKGRVDDVGNLPIVGLEHLSQSDIDLLGCSHEETTFTKGFLKGHVLFGRRRAYLKKASLAPFDGVCSGDVIVIEAKDGKLFPGLLPFIIQNDFLFDFAVENSAGSLSPRVKWKDLSRFEFDLPLMEEQEKLAELLWAAQETKRVYARLLLACDEMVKSRFIEMFGDYESNEYGWPKETLEERIRFLTSGSRGWAKYYSDDGELFITIKNVKGCKISLDDIQHVMPPHEAEASRTRVQEGDLLVSVTADLGRTGVVSADLAKQSAYINQHLMLVRLDGAFYNPLFVAYFMESPFGKEQFAKKNMTGVKAGLNFDSMRSFRLFRPPIDLQNEFVEFVALVDKSEYSYWIPNYLEIQPCV